jgi:hypothetical protein
MLMLGQVRLVSRPARLRPSLGNADGSLPQPVEYPCPLYPAANGNGSANAAQAFSVTVDPTLNCMRDARGNTICSDGKHYPPGCPTTPPDSAFSPGITPDVTTGSRIEGQIPAPRSAGFAAVTGAGGGLVAPLVIGGGVAAAALAAFFYFR